MFICRRRRVPLRTVFDNAIQICWRRFFRNARTRNIVERTIGVLKNRFRCILGARQLHYTPDMAAKITSVCASLHNICIHYKMDNPEIDELNEFPPTNSVVDDDLSALYIRTLLMQSLNI